MLLCVGSATLHLWRAGPRLRSVQAGRRWGGLPPFSCGAPSFYSGEEALLCKLLLTYLVGQAHCTRLLAGRCLGQWSRHFPAVRGEESGEEKDWDGCQAARWATCPDSKGCIQADHAFPVIPCLICFPCQRRFEKTCREGVRYSFGPSWKLQTDARGWERGHVFLIY